MMKAHCLLTFVLLILIKCNYATTTSVADQANLQRVLNSNPRSLDIEPPTAYLYRESIENDQDEDMVEDAELSPSEVIETHVMPDTPPDSDNSAMAAVGSGVHRVQRRRRRRRRRKRPKPTGPAPISAASAATATPSKLSTGFDTYYAVAEDEIPRKPYKYREGVSDENGETIASQGAQPYSGDDGVVDGYPRRRLTKRRRRPLKMPVDDYAPPSHLDNDDNNGDESWKKAENHAKHSPASQPVTTPIATSPSTTITTTSAAPVTSSSRKADLFKSTTALNRNKLPSSSYKEDASQSHKDVAQIEIADQPDWADNSLKRPKRPAAHRIQNEKDKNATLADQPRKPIEQNVVVNENSKLVENRKELFKLRRLPPTWAILGHARLGQSASVTAKNESTTEKSASHSNTSKQPAVGQSETVAVTKNNLVREPEQHPSTAYFKTSTTTVLPHDAYTDENETTTRTKFNDSESGDDSIPFPIIKTYAAPQQQQQRQKQHAFKTDVDPDLINSNASAFLSTNDQRLTIIYVPCNQTVSSTADKIFKNADAAFFHPTEENSIRHSNLQSNTADDSTAESNTDVGTATHPRRISTTRSPSHEFRIEDSTSISSTAHTTSTASAPSSSSTNYESREPKHYHDPADISDSKFNSKSEPTKKDHQTSSWPTRKPYPSPVANPALSKPFVGSSKEIIISYTSTTNVPPSLFSHLNIDSTDEQISLKLRNNNSSRNGEADGNNVLLQHKTSAENTPLINRIKQHHQQQQHPQHHHVERKKLPLAVKSAIIISGAVLALAVLGFFALLLSCKIRQAKSRMKCHRQLYRDQLQSNEFRQSSRSTSPVMSKSNFNTRNFTNNMQPSNAAAAASNRNYYLWQTLRKTFQYD